VLIKRLLLLNINSTAYIVIIDTYRVNFIADFVNVMDGKR